MWRIAIEFYIGPGVITSAPTREDALKIADDFLTDIDVLFVKIIKPSYVLGESYGSSRAFRTERGEKLSFDRRK